MSAEEKHSKKLCDIDNPLERGVFIAAYNSQTQRKRRLLAKLLLSIKHGLRGILFSWPLYLLPVSALALPGHYKYLFVLFLLPGVYVSALILKRGIKEDYADRVEDRLLDENFARQVLLKNG